MKKARPPAITITDAFSVFDKLHPKRFENLILVGGQASAFWTARYQSARPELLATKDIDFFLNGELRVPADCAKDLAGELEVVREPRAPDVARIRFRMDGSDLEIDFLRSVYGVGSEELIASKLAIEGELSGRRLYVMHPIYALASRLFNTFGLPGRLTGEDLSRLRFAVRATRAYLAERLMEADGEIEVRQSIEKIFAMSLSDEGLIAWTDYAIDIFGAVPDLTSRSGSKFVEKRYPQMLGVLQQKRALKQRRSSKQRSSQTARPRRR